MSYVPEVTARWKRRATEIADAIGGGESSSTVSGTVSLSTASITALADAIDQRFRLSAIAVSIADVLSVKTNANDSVAVTGTVSATLPANLVIPVDTVAGTNNGANGSGVAVTVPVNPTHNVTVPVKANSANQPMSSAGIPVTVPVNPTHTVTVPVKSNVSGQPLTLGNVVAQIGVAVGSTTVPVSVVTNTSQGASVFGTGVNVPVSGGLATIPVSNASGLTVQISNASGLVCDIANTNNVVVPVDTVSGTNNAANGSGVAVVVPVTASGTVLDVKLVEVGTAALPLDVNITGVSSVAKNEFHEAMETALEDADAVDVNIATVAASAKTQFHEAVETALNDASDIDVNSNLDIMTGYISNYVGASPNTTYTVATRDGGATDTNHVFSDATLATRVHGSSHVNKLVSRLQHNGLWYIGVPVVHVTDPRIGYVFNASTSVTGFKAWTIQDSRGIFIHLQGILWENTWQLYSTANMSKFRGATVHRQSPDSVDEWLVVALAT
jgi:hypothetical protein